MTSANAPPASKLRSRGRTLRTLFWVLVPAETLLPSLSAIAGHPIPTTTSAELTGPA